MEKCDLNDPFLFFVPRGKSQLGDASDRCLQLDFMGYCVLIYVNPLYVRGLEKRDSNGCVEDGSSNVYRGSLVESRVRFHA